MCENLSANSTLLLPRRNLFNNHFIVLPLHIVSGRTSIDIECGLRPCYSESNGHLNKWTTLINGQKTLRT